MLSNMTAADLAAVAALPAVCCYSPTESGELINRLVREIHGSIVISAQRGCFGNSLVVIFWLQLQLVSLLQNLLKCGNGACLRGRLAFILIFDHGP